jgi:hypothetical protein
MIFKKFNLNDVVFTLNANFELSGGFGTNQVSTVLGLGAFLVYIYWREKWILSGYRTLDVVLLILFIFRGLLTFSRGGIIGGFLAILVIIVFGTRGYEGRRILIKPVKAILGSLFVIMVFIMTFIYADKVTEGKLIMRYQGETQGTISGRREKDINILTTNRIQIFKDDLKLWKEHLLFGVGIGASRNLRDKTEGYLSHIEFSRLLSEHGIPGLIFVVILLVLGYRIFKDMGHSVYGIILFAMYIFAVYTTFHASMRTYISPILLGISLLFVPDEESEEDE